MTELAKEASLEQKTKDNHSIQVNDVVHYYSNVASGFTSHNEQKQHSGHPWKLRNSIRSPLESSGSMEYACQPLLPIPGKQTTVLVNKLDDFLKTLPRVLSRVSMQLEKQSNVHYAKESRHEQ